MISNSICFSRLSIDRLGIHLIMMEVKNQWERPQQQHQEDRSFSNFLLILIIHLDCSPFLFFPSWWTLSSITIDLVFLAPSHQAAAARFTHVRNRRRPYTPLFHGKKCLHYTELSRSMSLYTSCTSTTIETYVEAPMFAEWGGKKISRSRVPERQIRECTRKVSISDVLMTLTLIRRTERVGEEEINDCLDRGKKERECEVALRLTTRKILSKGYSFDILDDDAVISPKAKYLLYWCARDTSITWTTLICRQSIHRPWTHRGEFVGKKISARTDETISRRRSLPHVLASCWSTTPGRIICFDVRSRSSSSPLSRFLRERDFFPPMSTLLIDQDRWPCSSEA